VLPTNRDNIAQDNEIGPTNNRRFGLAAQRRADPDLKREYNWDYSFGIQHQLVPRVAINAGLYYTRFYNLQGTTNVLRSPSDYTSFQTANPLTGELMTIYNLNPAKQGIVDNVDKTSEVNGRRYRGYEAGVDARLPNGTSILGGWFMERLVSITCEVEDPNRFRFCDQAGKLFQELGTVPTLPFRHEFKLGVVHPLPWRLQAGLSILSYPGEALGVNWAVPANLFPGGRTEAVTVPLVAPGEKYLKRWNQVDINLKKSFTAGRFELRPSVDIYNLLNSSVVLTELQTFGATLGQPTSILQGRFVKLGLLAKF
jgi:outer membrane receptor protein involved in Fe transport